MASFLSIVNSRIRHTRVKRYRLEDFYLSSFLIRDVVVLECKKNEQAKARHLKTIAWLKDKEHPQSEKWVLYNDLSHEIQFSQNPTWYELTLDISREQTKAAEQMIEYLTKEKRFLEELLSDLQKERDQLMFQRKPEE